MNTAEDLPLAEDDIPDDLPEPENEPGNGLGHLDDESLTYLTRALQGVQSAKLRFFDASKGLQDDLISLLLALEIPSQSERILRMAPAPRRRFSIQYQGRAATITVSASMPLLG